MLLSLWSTGFPVCLCALQISNVRSNGHCQLKGGRTWVNQAATLCLKCKARHDLPLYLIVTLLWQNTTFPKDHPNSNQSHQDSMAKISKHHSKQKREGNDRIRCCKRKDDTPSALYLSKPRFTTVQFTQFSNIIPKLPLCFWKVLSTLLEIFTQDRQYRETPWLKHWDRYLGFL